VVAVSAPTPKALATAEAVFTLFMHDRGMPGWIWHRRATPDNVELVARIALALTEQAQAHEKCIEEIQADALVMANRENELHDEKDKRLAEQAREIEKWKHRASMRHCHDEEDQICEVCQAIEKAQMIEQTTWAAAATILREEDFTNCPGAVRALDRFRARAAAQEGVG
jgi:hypothetical protein